MTDVQKIVLALRCCITDEFGVPSCEHCPYKEEVGTCNDMNDLFDDTVNLIETQEETIAWLRDQVRRLTI